MEINRSVLSVLAGVFGLIYVFVLFPESDRVYDLYFADITTRTGDKYRMLVSIQTYVDYLAWRISMVIMSFIIFYYAKRYRTQILLFTILWAGFLLDYIIIYNQPVFYHNLGSCLLPISYSLVMGLLMTLTIILTLLNKWKA